MQPQDFQFSREGLRFCISSFLKQMIKSFHFYQKFRIFQNNLQFVCSYPHIMLIFLKPKKYFQRKFCFGRHIDKINPTKTKFRIEATKFRIEATKFRMEATKFRMEVQIQNRSYKIFESINLEQFNSEATSHEYRAGVEFQPPKFEISQRSFVVLYNIWFKNTWCGSIQYIFLIIETRCKGIVLEFKHVQVVYFDRHYRQNVSSVTFLNNTTMKRKTGNHNK